MIITGAAIETAISEGAIVFNPFDPDLVNPNSIDVNLGPSLISYTKLPLDPASDNPTCRIEIPADGYLMEAGEFILGATSQILGSTRYVPILHGKSGIARAGLFVHLTADLIDIGSVGNLTLQLFATVPIRLHSGMRIGQVSFWRPSGDISLYDGKYQGSSGPQPSKSFQDDFWSKG